MMWITLESVLVNFIRYLEDESSYKENDHDGYIVTDTEAAAKEFINKNWPNLYVYITTSNVSQDVLGQVGG